MAEAALLLLLLFNAPHPRRAAFSGGRTPTFDEIVGLWWRAINATKRTNYYLCQRVLGDEQQPTTSTTPLTEEHSRPTDRQTPHRDRKKNINRNHKIEIIKSKRGFRPHLTVLLALQLHRIHSIHHQWNFCQGFLSFCWPGDEQEQQQQQERPNWH